MKIATSIALILKKISKDDCLIISTILFGILVILTDKENLNSLSANDGMVNQWSYRLMHLSAIAWLFRNKKVKSNFWLGVIMGLVLAFDMYQHYWIHSVATISVMVAVFISIGLTTDKTKFNKIRILGSTIIALGIFAIGYFNSTFHFALAELIVIIIGLSLKRYELKNII